MGRRGARGGVPLPGRAGPDLREGARLSASLVESFSSDFDAEEFKDEYQEELRTLIEAKLEKGDAVDTAETFGEQEQEEAGGEVIDLMAALRASVEKSRAAREGSAKAGSEKTTAAASAKTDAKAHAKKPAAKKKKAS